jgi:hypothetical protein
MVDVRMTWRILFVGFIVLTCIVENQDALFTGGKSMQDVRNINEYSFFY